MNDPVTGRARGDTGTIALEALAAIVILGMTAVFTLLSVQGASKATIRVQNTDRATSFAYDTLDRARAFGCGTEVFDEDRLTVRLTNCGGTDNELGSAKFMMIDEDQNEYHATVRTQWARSDRTPTASCSHMTAPDDGRVAAPNILVRTVTVDYPTYQVRAERNIRFVESVPADAIEYASQIRGAIVIADVPDGGSVALTNPAGQVIRRFPDSNGCVWFPFVPSGSRTVTANPGGPLSLLVAPNATTCRRSSGGPC